MKMIKYYIEIDGAFEVQSLEYYARECAPMYFDYISVVNCAITMEGECKEDSHSPTTVTTLNVL